MNTNNSIIIDPIKKVHGTIFLPGSKSISNRALLLAAQSVGKTRLINLLDCDDVNFMLTALKNLGVKYSFLNNKKICEIHGLGGVIQTKNKLFLSLGNAGTVIRPLTAALSIKFQDVILTGNIRMRKRPISHLIDALRQGGSRIDYIENEKYLPIKLYGGYQGGKISIQGNISSQFLSSILMMAPLAPRDTYITINGILVSKPYIDITLSLMKAFGITVQNNNYCSFYCKGNRLYKSPGDYLIEGDATSASYFLAASAIRGGSVRVVGVGRHSKQGDIHFAHVLEKMGANICWNDNYIECTKAKNLNSIDMDLSFMPDAAMTLAIVSLFVKNKLSTLRNIYNWRVKESDRLSAMACELRKVGAKVFEGYDYLEITPPKKIKKAKIDTYDDHRIAMCFSLIPLSGVPITIFNPKCVYKTFPDFFKKFLEISIMY